MLDCAQDSTNEQNVLEKESAADVFEKEREADVLEDESAANDSPSSVSPDHGSRECRRYRPNNS
jgi:hypothetical protein